jgi:hypothetical protein
MENAPRNDSQVDRQALAEQAMRCAATIIAELTDCRRRACRRNGCCGALVDSDCGPGSGHEQAGFGRIPCCVAGVDAEVADRFAEYSRVMLGLLVKMPGCDLRPARLLRTFGTSRPLADDAPSAGVASPKAAKP